MRAERFLTLMPFMLRFAAISGTGLLLAALLVQLFSGGGPNEIERILRGEPLPLSISEHPLQMAGFALILLGPISRLILSSLGFFSQRERILGYFPLLSLFFIGMTALVWDWIHP